MVPSNPYIIRIVRKALAITAPEDRARYIDAACGRDALLRRQVDEQLAAHEEAHEEPREETCEEPREEPRDEVHEEAHEEVDEELDEETREADHKDAHDDADEEVENEFQQEVEENVRDDAQEVVQEETREDDLEDAHDETHEDGREDAQERTPEDPRELPAEIADVAPNEGPLEAVDSSVTHPPPATTDDSQRFLADEAVEPPPPSPGSPAGKSLQHNRGPVVAVVVLAVALIGGVIGTRLVMIRAGAALREESEQRQIAATREHEAIDARAAAPAAVAQERPAEDHEAEQQRLADERKQLAEEDEQNEALLRQQNLAASGLDLLKQEKWSEAEPLLRECLELGERLANVPRADGATPLLVASWQIADAKSMLGAALTGQKRFAEAEPLLLAGCESLTADENSIPARVRGRLTESLQRLVRLYDTWQKPDEAARWRNELEGRSLAAVHNGRGWGAFARRNYDSAIEEFTRAIESRPRFALAYNNRGLAWAAQGDHDRAIEDYSEAIRLDPQFAEMYRNRGLAWQAKGEMDKALSDYSEAVRLDPQSAEGYNHRAWLQATAAEARLRDGRQAIVDATRACALTEWKNAMFLDTLAAAYAESGDFAQAVEWQRQALELASPALKKELATRLELYESGKPFREEPPARP